MVNPTQLLRKFNCPITSLSHNRVLMITKYLNLHLWLLLLILTTIASASAFGAVFLIEPRLKAVTESSVVESAVESAVVSVPESDSQPITESQPEEIDEASVVDDESRHSRSAVSQQTVRLAIAKTTHRQFT